MDQDPKKQTQSFQYVRLSGFARVVRVVSTIGLLLVGGALYVFRPYFTFVDHPVILQWAFVGLFVWSSLVFIAMEVFKRGWIFYLNHVGWIIFYFFVIYTTGGVNSGFSFLLVIPILTSTFDLNPAQTKWVGIAATASYGMIIFMNPENLHHPGVMVAHAIKTFILSVIAIYMHRLVKESIRHKFEKEEANKKYYEILEVDRLKSTFATVVSHQLRNPLAGARFGMSTLLSSLSPQRDLAAIGPKILERIETAISILNDIFKTLAVGAEGFRRKNQSFDLGALLTDIIDELSDFASTKKTKVIYRPETSAFVEGDREMLKIAFMNIIDNAIRYSPQGEATITLERQGDWVKTTVMDTGMGIPSDDQPHIFERFYRGTNALRLEPNESGIGLFISREIIGHYLGSIELVASGEHGTTMAITLPVVKKSA